MCYIKHNSIAMLNSKYLLLLIGFAIIAKSSAVTGVWSITRNLIQNNVVGRPALHQNTEWDFDPEQGKARRTRFEMLNGRLGEDLIARLGQGMDVDGPWGEKVAKVKPDVRYYNLQS